MADEFVDIEDLSVSQSPPPPPPQPWPPDLSFPPPNSGIALAESLCVVGAGGIYVITLLVGEARRDVQSLDDLV